jgi:hypothetical protein
MKILVSLQRSGSTWVYKHMHAHNVLYHKAENASPHEFFGPGFHKRIKSLRTDEEQKLYWKELRNKCKNIDLSSTTDKMKFILEEKSDNRHYSIKIIPSQVRDYEESFLNVCDGYDIITLVRRDMWQCCLSALIQDATGWIYTHDRSDGTEKNLLKSIKNKIILDNYKTRIKTTFRNLDFIENIKTHSKYKLYYEDLSAEFLIDYFGLTNKKYIHNFVKFDIDYESFIENLDEVKEEYEKYI